VLNSQNEMLPARRLAAGNFRLRRRRQASQTATAASEPTLIAGIRMESPDEPDPPPSIDIIVMSAKAVIAIAGAALMATFRKLPPSQPER